MEQTREMVYAQPGTSNQQIGGVMPDDWIVMLTEKDGEGFKADPAGVWVPLVPQTVSRFQGREAMWQTPHGETTLFEAAEVVLADPATPAVYRRAWDDLQEFRRDSEMLAAIASTLGLTAAQIDGVFILAASIQA
ncbi:hypothetical protein [Achromobacter spanius]